MPTGQDFCMVRLSAAGEAFCGGHPLSAQNGRWHYLFHSAEEVRMTKYEWNLYFSTVAAADGVPLLELVPVGVPVLVPSPVPDPAAAAPVAPVATTVPAPTA